MWPASIKAHHDELFDALPRSSDQDRAHVRSALARKRSLHNLQNDANGNIGDGVLHYNRKSESGVILYYILILDSSQSQNQHR